MDSISGYSTYYAVLGCDRTSTTEQIKKKFQELARQFHPDKCFLRTQDENHFLTINEAWNTLRDSELRKQYDAKLKSKELEPHLFYATLSPNEMNVDETDVYSYPCRCGGMYMIAKEDMISHSECILDCDDCSFSILVRT